MLSIDECRNLIDGGEKYSDQEIEEIRDACRALTEVMFEQWTLEREQKRK